MAVSLLLLYHNTLSLQPKNAAKNAIHCPSRMAHNIQCVETGECRPVPSLHHVRRFPDGSSESSNPLSSAFASSSNLSSPLFFSCVYPQISLLAPSQHGQLPGCMNDIDRRVADMESPPPRPLKILPVSLNPQAQDVGGGITYLCTSH
jgi:hypothetical protein